MDCQLSRARASRVMKTTVPLTVELSEKPTSVNKKSPSQVGQEPAKGNVCEGNPPRRLIMRHNLSEVSTPVLRAGRRGFLR